MTEQIIQFLYTYPIVGIVLGIVLIVIAINLAKTILQAAVMVAIVLAGYAIFILATDAPAPDMDAMRHDAEQIADHAKEELKGKLVEKQLKKVAD